MAANYDKAYEICSRHGAEILLPTEAENDEVKEFLRVQEWAGNFQRSPFAWLRLINLDAPTGQRWVDARTREPLTWDGAEGGLLSSSYESNGLLYDHASNSDIRAHTGNLMKDVRYSNRHIMFRVFWKMERNRRLPQLSSASGRL